MFAKKTAYVFVIITAFSQSLCEVSQHVADRNLIVDSFFDNSIALQPHIDFKVLNLLPEFILFAEKKDRKIQETRRKNSNEIVISGLKDIVDPAGSFDAMTYNLNAIPKKIIDALGVDLFLRATEEKIACENKKFILGKAEEKIDTLLCSAASYNTFIDYINFLSKLKAGSREECFIDKKALPKVEVFKIKAMCNQIIADEYFGSMIRSLNQKEVENSSKLNALLKQIIVSKDMFFMLCKALDKKMQLARAIILYNNEIHKLQTGSLKILSPIDVDMEKIFRRIDDISRMRNFIKYN